MNDIEREVLSALNDLNEKVLNVATSSPKPDLLPLFARIDQLAKQLPPGSNPELSHFLHKRSYEKARLALLGRNSENAPGSCGH